MWNANLACSLFLTYTQKQSQTFPLWMVTSSTHSRCSLIRLARIQKSQHVWVCVRDRDFNTAVFAAPSFNVKLFGHIFRTQSRPIANVTMLRSSSNRHQCVLFAHQTVIRRSVYNLGQPHVCICDDKCKRVVIFSWIFGYSHSAMIERMSSYQFFRMPTVKSQFDASLFSIKLNKKWVWSLLAVMYRPFLRIVE